jgi:hypothetical protein
LIFYIIYYNILLSFLATYTTSIKPTTLIKPKLCIDCKFFKKGLFDANKFGKCSLFPIKDNDFFLVDGIVKSSEYNYCSISRKYENMCGEEAKLYEKK